MEESISNQRINLIEIISKSDEIPYKEMKEKIKYGEYKIMQKDDQGKNSLHHSIQHPTHAFKLTELLLKYNADPNRMDKNRKTPLYYCCDENKSLDLIKLLINYGADTNIKDIFGYSSLFAILFKNTYKTENNIDFEKLIFLLNKSNLDQVDKIGNSGNLFHF